MRQLGERDMAANEPTLRHLRGRTAFGAQGTHLSRAASGERAATAANRWRVWHCRRFWHVVIFTQARCRTEEHLRIRMQWRIEECIGIDHLHQFAAIEDGDSVGQLPHDREVM